VNKDTYNLRLGGSKKGQYGDGGCARCALPVFVATIEIARSVTMFAGTLMSRDVLTMLQ